MHHVIKIESAKTTAMQNESTKLLCKKIHYHFKPDFQNVDH